MKSIMIDQKEYVVVETISLDDIKYIYLSYIDDEKDICIRKEVKGDILPLDNEKEFQKSLLLFAQKNKDLMLDLLNK